MRLPKWLVAALLVASAVAGVGILACLWVLWPRQTARSFVDVLSAGDREGVNRFLLANDQFNPRDLGKGSELALEWLRRDANELLTGRQRFVVRNVPLTFTAHHGTIAVDRFRTVAIATNETFTLNLWDYPKRITIDQSHAVHVKVNRQNPYEVVVVGLAPSDGVSVKIDDRSGTTYDVRITIK